MNGPVRIPDMKVRGAVGWPRWTGQRAQKLMYKQASNLTSGKHSLAMFFRKAEKRWLREKFGHLQCQLHESWPHGPEEMFFFGNPMVLEEISQKPIVDGGAATKRDCYRFQPLYE
jgi:hypothetical protein